MLEIDHRLLTAVEKILRGYENVHFFRKKRKLYVSSGDYHVFDSLNDFFTTLTNYKVRELTDKERYDADMEDDYVYIAIVESD